VRVGRQLAGLLERQQVAAERDLDARIEDVALRGRLALVKNLGRPRRRRRR
jgi:hypothetical protein